MTNLSLARKLTGCLERSLKYPGTISDKYMERIPSVFVVTNRGTFSVPSVSLSISGWYRISCLSIRYTSLPSQSINLPLQKAIASSKVQTPNRKIRTPLSRSVHLHPYSVKLLQVIRYGSAVTSYIHIPLLRSSANPCQKTAALLHKRICISCHFLLHIFFIIIVSFTSHCPKRMTT